MKKIMHFSVKMLLLKYFLYFDFYIMSSSKKMVELYQCNWFMIKL